MSLAINVQDGTSAGKRRLLEPVRWKHVCPKIGTNLGEPAAFVVMCSDYSCPYGCGARRPS